MGRFLLSVDNNVVLRVAENTLVLLNTDFTFILEWSIWEGQKDSVK